MCNTGINEKPGLIASFIKSNFKDDLDCEHFVCCTTTGCSACLGTSSCMYAWSGDILQSLSAGFAAFSLVAVTSKEFYKDKRKNSENKKND